MNTHICINEPARAMGVKYRDASSFQVINPPITAIESNKIEMIERTKSIFLAFHNLLITRHKYRSQ
jgi:hypothetical protein